MKVISRRTVIHSTLGLGTAVSKIATPIAAALKMPCVDPETKKLKPESPCGQRKAFLDALFPNINPLATRPEMQPPQNPPAV